MVSELHITGEGSGGGGGARRNVNKSASADAIRPRVSQLEYSNINQVNRLAVRGCKRMLCR